MNEKQQLTFDEWLQNEYDINKAILAECMVGSVDFVKAFCTHGVLTKVINEYKERNVC